MKKRWSTNPEGSCDSIPIGVFVMSLVIAAEVVPLRMDRDGVARVGGTRVTLESLLAAYCQGATAEEKAKDARGRKKGWWPFGGDKKKEAKSQEVKKEGPAADAKDKPLEYGTIEVRKLRLGYMTQDLVEVDEGLQEDELIVTEIQEELKDKTRVEIMEVQEGLI